MSFMGNLAGKRSTNIPEPSVNRILEYRSPVRFDDIKLSMLRDMAVFSRIVYTNFGYTGLLDEPWHDYPDLSGFIKKAKKIKKGFKRPFDDFYKKFSELDISVKAYSILLLPLVEYNRFEYPLLCFYHPDKITWFRDLRTYCKNRENLDRIADFMYKFYQLQVEHYGRSYINSFSAIKEDSSGRRLGIYYDVFHRIKQLDHININPEDWLEFKFNKINKAFPKDIINISTVINMNGFELNEEEIKLITNDSWRKIRMFLGLSSECEFLHGYIPKGWRPLDIDLDRTKDIVRIEGNGFYYDKRGAQKRGVCHYLSNNYLIIKCDPTNFEEFVRDWDNISLRTKKPTWEEYKKWAIYPDIYGEDGSPSNPRIKGVSWRKR